MIIFDIGANDGRDSRKLSKKHKGSIVYAFEPTPYLLEKFLYPLQQERKNIIIVPAAVHSYDGIVELNIAGHYDWGCSSLYQFSEGLEKTWPGRQDLHKTESILVPCLTLKTFLLENKIDQVDYLHCDTQGNDLVVLQSCGECLPRIKEGVIEVYNTAPLYKGISNSKKEALAFLEGSGFEIQKIRPNDPYGNEENIFFKRRR